ncbi:hypothetical protein V0M98_37315 (plasmid) [Pseudomonas silesiensis]|uniref:hypothetical protein n=1 Tax=Pseudomonas silesiensis TaxID=1853130 RepID=UPI0030CCD793
MSDERYATIVNAGAAVTPLNFRPWLRSELRRQSYSGHKSGGVEVYVFVTKAFITALGRKKLHKIISDTVELHCWIRDTQVITTEIPVTAEQATNYVETQGDEGL